MSYVLGLKCRECGKQYPQKGVHVCDVCFGPLEVEYDYAAMAGKVTRASIEARDRNLWRYRDLLPIDGQPVTGHHSGWTPLKRARNLERRLGVRELYLKDDSANYPTWSYKERVVSVAITKAVELGYDTVGCASTGNLANSVAAHAAEAGLKAFVMIPHDLELGKVLGSLIFGPTMVRIQGNYDDVNRLCSEIADKYNWAIVNVNLRPFYTEGAKTFGFEIAEQLGWKLPRHTIVPTAGGTILPKVYKAYQEFIKLGLVEDNSPRIYSAQAAGCNRIPGSPDTNSAAGERLSRAGFAHTSEGNGSRAFHGTPLDFGPGFGIRGPGMGCRLVRRQGGRPVVGSYRTGIDLTDGHPLTSRFQVKSGRTAAKGDVDQPERGCVRWIAPKEGRGRDFGGKIAPSAG